MQYKRDQFLFAQKVLKKYEPASHRAMLSEEQRSKLGKMQGYVDRFSEEFEADERQMAFATLPMDERTGQGLPEPRGERMTSFSQMPLDERTGEGLPVRPLEKKPGIFQQMVNVFKRDKGSGAVAEPGATGVHQKPLPLLDDTDGTSRQVMDDTQRYNPTQPEDNTELIPGTGEPMSRKEKRWNEWIQTKRVAEIRKDLSKEGLAFENIPLIDAFSDEITKPLQLGEAALGKFSPKIADAREQRKRAEAISKASKPLDATVGGLAGGLVNLAILHDVTGLSGAPLFMMDSAIADSAPLLEGDITPREMTINLAKSGAFGKLFSAVNAGQEKLFFRLLDKYGMKLKPAVAVEEAAGALGIFGGATALGVAGQLANKDKVQIGNAMKSGALLTAFHLLGTKARIKNILDTELRQRAMINAIEETSKTVLKRPLQSSDKAVLRKYARLMDKLGMKYAPDPKNYKAFKKYNIEVKAWQKKTPQRSEYKKESYYLKAMQKHLESMPEASSKALTEHQEYMDAVQKWQANNQEFLHNEILRKMTPAEREWLLMLRSHSMASPMSETAPSPETITFQDSRSDKVGEQGKTTFYRTSYGKKVGEKLDGISRDLAKGNVAAAQKGMLLIEQNRKAILNNAEGDAPAIKKRIAILQREVAGEQPAVERADVEDVASQDTGVTKETENGSEVIRPEVDTAQEQKKIKQIIEDDKTFKKENPNYIELTHDERIKYIGRDDDIYNKIQTPEQYFALIKYVEKNPDNLTEELANIIIRLDEKIGAEDYGVSLGLEDDTDYKGTMKDYVANYYGIKGKEQKQLQERGDGKLEAKKQVEAPKPEIQQQAETDDTGVEKKKTEKQPYEMTREELKNFIRNQKDGVNSRLTFDDFNKDGTKEYTYPHDIRVGDKEYKVMIRTGDHRKGRHLTNTNPYISVIGLKDFKIPFGIEGLQKKHINKIITEIHKEQIEQALSEGKPVPAEVLKDYPDLVEKNGKKEITEQGEESGAKKKPAKKKSTGEATGEEAKPTVSKKETVQKTNKYFEGSYFTLNSDNKVELHLLDKATYQNFPEEIKKVIKSNFVWGRQRKAWVSRSKGGYVPYSMKKYNIPYKGKDALNSFEEMVNRRSERLQNKAERYAQYSKNAEQRAKSLQSEFNRLRKDWAWLTQPASSRSSFGKQRDRVMGRYEKGFEERIKSEEMAGYAEELGIMATQPELKDLGYLKNRLKENKKILNKFPEFEEYYNKEIAKKENLDDATLMYLDGQMNRYKLAFDKYEYYKHHYDKLVEHYKEKGDFFDEDAIKKTIKKDFKKFLKDKYDINLLKMSIAYKSKSGTVYYYKTDKSLPEELQSGWAADNAAQQNIQIIYDFMQKNKQEHREEAIAKKETPTPPTKQTKVSKVSNTQELTDAQQKILKAYGAKGAPFAEQLEVLKIDGAIRLLNARMNAAEEGGDITMMSAIAKKLRAENAKLHDLKKNYPKYANIDSFSGEIELGRIEMPEMVRLMKQIGGSVPLVRRLRAGLRGYFSPGREKIVLSNELWNAENQSQWQGEKTFAHEFGHMIDWLPDRIMKRGNLLGRLMTLRGVRNGIMAKRGINVALLKERKSIMAKLYRAGRQEKAGVKHRYDVPMLEARLNEIDGDLLFDKELRGELWNLSTIWRPLSSWSKGYLQYRRSAPELYADFISALFNKPDFAKEKAPTFYKEFFNYLDTKPKFQKDFFDLLDTLTGSRGDIMQARANDLDVSLQKSEQIFNAKNDLVRSRKRDILFELKYHFVNRNQAIREMEKKQGITEKDDQVSELLDSQYFIDMRIKTVMSKFQKIREEMWDAGISDSDLDETLMMFRTLTDRADIANPMGYTPESSLEFLTWLEQKMGKETSRRMQDIVEEMQDWWMHEIIEPADDLITPEKMKELQEARSMGVVYAPYFVQKYFLDGNVSAALMGQLGTLEEVMSPQLMFVLKGAAIIRARDHNAVKLEAAETLFVNDPESDEIHLEYGAGGRLIQPPSKAGREIVFYKKKGKLHGWYVDPYVADCFKYDTPRVNMLVNKILAPGNRVIKALHTTYNLGFALFTNPKRDFDRTYNNLSFKGKNVSVMELLRLYAKNLKHAKARAKGEADDVTSLMENDEMLFFNLSDWIGRYSDLELSKMKSVDQMMHKYGVEGNNKKPWIGLRPALWVLNQIKYINDVMEPLSKMAAYEYLKDEVGPDKIFKSQRALATFIRDRIGTPPFNKQGRSSTVTNQAMLYSNIMIQSYIQDFRAWNDPRTKAGVRRKVAKKYVLRTLWKMAWGAGAVGLLASWLNGGNKKEKEETRRKMAQMWAMIPEYDKTNYTVIPLGMHKGRCVYLRFAMHETERLLQAVTWKLLNGALDIADGGDARMVLRSAGDVFDYGIGQVPTLTPEVGIPLKWIGLMSGKQPMDNYRQQPIVNDTEMDAGGMAKVAPMAMWTLNQLGYRSGYKSLSGEDTLVKLIKRSPGLNRVIKISNWGIDEALDKSPEVSKVKRESALAKLHKKEFMKDYTREYFAKAKDGGLEMNFDIFSGNLKMMVEELSQGEDELTPTQFKELAKLYSRQILKAKSNPWVNSLNYTRTNDEKMAKLAKMNKMLTIDQMREVLTVCSSAGILSKVNAEIAWKSYLYHNNLSTGGEK